MPLKLRDPKHEIVHDYASLQAAFVHFLGTHYEPIDNPLAVLEVRNAFFAGANYMKLLVHRASKLSGAEVQPFISRLYKELINEAEQNRATWVKTYQDYLTPIAIVPVQQAAPVPEFAQSTPVPVSTAAPAPAPQTASQPMMWTIGMVTEFEGCYNGAKAAGAQTFPFKDHSFRTQDAPGIINHLKQVFANDQPQPPRERQ